jgi:hypothetical protein
MVGACLAYGQIMPAPSPCRYVHCIQQIIWIPDDPDTTLDFTVVLCPWHARLIEKYRDQFQRTRLGIEPQPPSGSSSNAT